MARLLVTGASGFVGREALAALCAGEDEVFSAGRKLPEGPWPARWHGLDLQDRRAVEALLREIRPQAILHLAWEVEHGRFWTSPANLDSLGASLALLRAAAGVGVKRFVGVGTCFEYVWPDDGDCDERLTPLGPQTLYGIAKDAARRVGESFCREQSISFAWARLFHLAGPREDERRLAPSLAIRLLRGEPAPLSNGLMVRDFMDVRDAGRALALLTRSDLEGPINIASGEGVSVAEIAGELGRLTGRPDLLRFGAYPERTGEPPRIVAAVARLRDELNFVPRHDRPSMLKDCLAYWSARRGHGDTQGRQE